MDNGQTVKKDSRRNEELYKEYEDIGYGVYQVGDSMHSHIPAFENTILQKAPNEYNCCFYCIQLSLSGYTDDIGPCDFFGSIDKKLIDNTKEKTCNLYEPHLNRFRKLLETMEKCFLLSTNFELRK